MEKNVRTANGFAVKAAYSLAGEVGGKS